jgi:hypothetical protein
MDIIFAWADRHLAALACHEGDIHIYCEDEAVLQAAAKQIKRLGLVEVDPACPLYRA